MATLGHGRTFGLQTWLQTGDYKVLPDSAVVTYPRFKAALLRINVSWPPVWACAYAYRTDYDELPLFPGAELFRSSSGFHIPWLGYLSAPLASGFELPPEILTERTPDGGLLHDRHQGAARPHGAGAPAAATGYRRNHGRPHRFPSPSDRAAFQGRAILIAWKPYRGQE